MDKQIITCLLGDPVDHSVSDTMFQYFAKLSGIVNYKHFKFKIPKDNYRNLQLAIQAIRLFDIVGANITLPYKVEAMKYLDKIDKTVQLTGAVNTIVNRGGKIIGYNTDGHGAMTAIKTKLRPIKSSDKILILGAGGATRAIIGSLPVVSHITVLNRESDIKRARKLKKDFLKHGIKIEINSLADGNIISGMKEANFIVNATPVGMYPENNNSLIQKHHLDSIDKSIIKKLCFFDAIFNPFETKFLKLAKQYGAKTCPGIYMMIYQGIQAFKLWTGGIVLGERAEEIRGLLAKRIQSQYEK